MVPATSPDPSLPDTSDLSTTTRLQDPGQHQIS
jgi:hypothetical protein